MMSNGVSSGAQQQDSLPLPELLPGLSTAVRALARAAKNVPEPSDIYYYKNIPEYKQLSESISSKAQALLDAAAANLSRPLQGAAGASGARASSGPAAAAGGSGSDGDEDDESVFAQLSTLLDDTYERLDTALDASKASSAALKLGGWAIPQHSTARHGSRLGAAARGGAGSSVASVAGGGRIRRHIAGLPRPQDSFTGPVDNSDSPWTPSRFNHLAARLVAAAAGGASSGSSSSGGSAVHPYVTELGSLQYQPWQLQKQAEGEGEAGDLVGLESAPCTLVDTPEGLAAMVQALQDVRQVALDLEHHSYRSYQGFTCLLQLSTRDADWVVDTLALRAQLGPALAPLLAHPGVEKVLHGADNDVLWLQRDFGLYIINLFDTGQAARVLAYPSASLAYLLEAHVGYSADKRYQLADWRLRPLPDDMMAYARADTRFLLWVSDRLKDELRALGDRMPPSWALDLPPHCGAAGALGCVYERSRQLCLQVYVKPRLSPTAHLEAALRWGLALPPRNMMAFAALYSWRDRTARALDESVHYVMPKAALLELSRALPSTAGDVRKLLGKGSGLSGGTSLLLSRAEEVAQVIVEGQQQQQQPPGADTAPGDGMVQPPAPAAAAAVRPKELPALVPRKVAAPAVRAVKPAAAGGMRGLFGKAGSSSSAAVVQHNQDASKQEAQQQEAQQQQDLGPAAALATQQQLPQQQLPQQQLPQQWLSQQQLPQEQLPQQQQLQQQASADALTNSISSSGGSKPAAKPIAPACKGSSSLGGLFARKQQPAASAAAGAAVGVKRSRFKVDYLLPAADTAAAAARGQASAVAAVADAVTATAATAAATPSQDVAAALGPGQVADVQRVSSAAVRAVVNQLMADGDDAEGDAAADGAAAAAEGSSPVAAAGEGSGEGSDGGLGGEFVPLSLQGPKGKHKRKAAAAALLAVEAVAANKRRHVEQHDSPGRKSKGIFDCAGNDSDTSESDSELEGAAMPSFNPRTLNAAAAAAAGDGKAGSAVADEDLEAEADGHRGRGRGRGSRGRGGRRGSGGRGSLASVRRQQGGAAHNIGKNMFEVQDGPFKPARRKGVAGGKSRTFK